MADVRRRRMPLLWSTVREAALTKGLPRMPHINALLNARVSHYSQRQKNTAGRWPYWLAPAGVCYANQETNQWVQS